MSVLSTEPQANRWASVQVISEGVLASYIHHISERHGQRPVTAGPARSHIPNLSSVLEKDSQSDE